MTAQDIAKALTASDKGIMADRMPKLKACALRAGVDMSEVLAAFPDDARKQVQDLLNEVDRGR